MAGMVLNYWVGLGITVFANVIIMMETQFFHCETGPCESGPIAFKAFEGGSCGGSTFVGCEALSKVS